MDTAVLNNLMAWYIIAAVVYNLLSLLSKEIGGRTFTPTDPVNGIITEAAFYSMFLLRDLMPPVAAVVVLGAFAVVIGWFGVIRHAMGYSGESYKSRTTWALAIAINSYGVPLILLSLLPPLAALF